MRSASACLFGFTGLHSPLDGNGILAPSSLPGRPSIRAPQPHPGARATGSSRRCGRRPRRSDPTGPRDDSGARGQFGRQRQHRYLRVQPRVEEVRRPRSARPSDSAPQVHPVLGGAQVAARRDSEQLTDVDDERPVQRRARRSSRRRAAAPHLQAPAARLGQQQREHPGIPVRAHALRAGRAGGIANRP